MHDVAWTGTTGRRFELLLRNTQRALIRNGIRGDEAIAPLCDRDLYRLAFIGPVGRQDIRRYFPNQ